MRCLIITTIVNRSWRLWSMRERTGSRRWMWACWIGRILCCLLISRRRSVRIRSPRLRGSCLIYWRTIHRSWRYWHLLLCLISLSSLKPFSSSREKTPTFKSSKSSHKNSKSVVNIAASRGRLYSHILGLRLKWSWKRLGNCWRGTRSWWGCTLALHCFTCWKSVKKLDWRDSLMSTNRLKFVKRISSWQLKESCIFCQSKAMILSNMSANCQRKRITLSTRNNQRRMSLVMILTLWMRSKKVRNHKRFRKLIMLISRKSWKKTLTSFWVAVLSVQLIQ